MTSGTESPYVTTQQAMELLGYKHPCSIRRLENARLLTRVGGTRRIKRFRRSDVMRIIEGKATR